MKYKELEKVATELSYSIRKDETDTIIKKYNEEYDRTDAIFIGELQRNKIIIHMVATCPGDLDMVHAAMQYANTPLENREEEKRYIIPLPYLVTTDGERQYLTHNGSFFACRRNKGLRQTWKEKELIYIPVEYRGFAVEVEE